ncbi:NAD(P)H-hydrate dehydratase [Rubinisphaera italica]|uniref:ADP-dependent (S)-NAD(P)H-hydrate dehydratase n=1 Tax=Rubinisphaera italica TaxID=2527969 RepID=A0A5C5XN30_9PLAN|nr:NAD(P)H-hydrate dehydratase [Rubinisphaera italica]TWT64118.1 ATP-dependent (S)-NAD(P)H-hydrate dehydratase [Rubinisphaera italica]
MRSHLESLPALPTRDQDSHKGSYGTVLLIGGSRGMAGSIALSGIAALRTGCGLAFLACPESSQGIIASFEPSYLTIGLPEDEDGRISYEANSRIREQMNSAHAIAIGPGLGSSRDTELLLLDLYATTEQPLVIDADGLNALSRLPDGLPKPNGPRILTPHPGEMGRLTKTDAKTVQQNREEIAAEFAEKQQCIVVLKGHQTVVTDGQTVFVNMTGNSGLATGGTGDVLTGVITSLIAQGLSPFDATRVGVYLHGSAAEIIAEKIGEDGLIASDLPLAVAEAIHRYRLH